MNRSSFWNKLSVKLLAAIAASFIISLAAMILISRYVMDYYINNATRIGVMQYNLIAFLMLSAIIILFIISFLLLVRKKFTYLKEITQGVQKIANGELGATIEIKGNDELAQLGKNINYMSKELESKFEHERKIESVKNEFITNISHDLRTPLTSIIGYVDLLRKKEYKEEEQLTEYLNVIYAKSQNLHNLMDELFEYTKLASPDVTMNLSEIELAGLFEQVIGEYIPIIEQAGMAIQKSITKEELLVKMDVEKMVRVYENLLMNAIKYSRKPSLLKVNLSVHGENAIFSISNQVENLHNQKVERFFERFYRGDQARKEDGGSGLGLAIAKKIIELHDGTIEVDYNDGWMTFTIILQLTKVDLQENDFL